MKLRLLPLLACLFILPPSYAQSYSLEVEVVSEDIGILIGALGVVDLTGYSCTRLYVNMENTDDFMSSVSGDAVNPTYINTTTNFYHAVLGGQTPNGINSVLFPVYPDLAYDSWVTIGLDGVPNAAAGEAAVATVQSTSNPWATNFDLGGGIPGNNIAIDDDIGGAWYALNGDANGVAGDDLKVLVGQFTTTGELSGQLYCQVFINGEGSNEYRETFFIGGSAGCTDETACNFDPEATVDDDSCIFPETNLDCDGNCLNDADSDGICDEDEISGCTDELACNYDFTATDEDGSCEFATPGLDCDGNCLNDADSDGICDDDEIDGCTDIDACNFDTTATDDDGSCTFPDSGYDCSGNCLDDADGDGVCDGDEVAGCTDEMACNYDATATDNDGSCEFAADGLDCDGNCLEDADGDGVCDGDEIDGCTDETACNYDPTATDDNGSCDFAGDGLDCDGNCLEDADEDGVCDADEVPGCTDETACNYDTAATDDNGSCEFAAEGLDCDGNCLEDADEDGICDGDEIPGCTDASATNYDEGATDDDGSCEYGCSPEWGDPIVLPAVATVIAQITVGGENASTDDAVGAFINGELRGEADVVDYEGESFVSMTVYLSGGDEEVEFVLFNSDDCSECAIDGDLTVMGFGEEYGTFDAPLMLDADCDAGTLEVELMEGWNYVSTNLIPDNYAIASLFEDALDGSLLKVLGDDVFALGQSYTPGIPSVFNSLQMHSDAAGYVIKVDADGIWTSSGTALDAASTPLDLNEGWNIIGYVPQEAMPVEDALSSIEGLVGTVIDGQNGTVWNPSNPNEFNSLLDMEPGRSYWVRMLEAATLIYPEATDSDGSGMVMADLRSDDAAEAMTGWEVIRAPGAAALAAEIQVNEVAVDGEAYIGAFVGESCVAVRTVMPFGNMTAAQLAPMVSGICEVEFRLWVDGEVLISQDIMTMEGGDEFGQGGDILPIIRFHSETNAVSEMEGISSVKISPVPSDGDTWLDFELREPSQMRIAVHDARGAVIAVLKNGTMAPGQHRLHIDMTPWATGTYFVRGMGDAGTFSMPLIVR